VEVVPHIPLEVIDRIKRASEKDNSEITMIEIGGTVGEYQNVLFLETIRMMKIKNPDDVLSVLVSYVPMPNKIGEMKTKPTQYAVRTVNSAGVQPDFIIARSEVPMDQKRKEKISMFCNVGEEYVISAPDVDNVYEVLLNFERDNLSQIILKKLGLENRESDLSPWKNLVEKIKTAKGSVTIGIVGKYFGTGDFVLSDAYISVIEAIKHAGYKAGVKTKIDWINSETFEKEPEKISSLSQYDGILVPGGFGGRGIEGKIKAIEYCRKNKIPFFGICYGMQLAVIEYARNVLGLSDAHTTEVDRDTKNPVIDIMPEQKKNLEDGNYGATMRLGAYPAKLTEGTIAKELYATSEISERHRHRWEVNPEYIGKIQQAGLVFSGKSPEGKLMEIAELPIEKHPFFVACQFHPEFKSNPLQSHPLFFGFVSAAKERSTKK
jgi:CTP synthase